MLGSWQHPYTVIDRMKRGQRSSSRRWHLPLGAHLERGFCRRLASACLARQDAIGEAFQITSDEVLTWDQICRETARAAGVEADIVHVPSDLIAAYDPACRRAA